jgi:hypothetical protein
LRLVTQKQWQKRLKWVHVGNGTDVSKA